MFWLSRNCLWLLVLVGSAAALAQPRWRLVWSDEFQQPEGTPPSSARWTFDTGGHGWGNSELQSYTTRRANSRVEGGMLVIEARKEPYTGTDGIRREYTSARLKTMGKASWTYGRMEARIQIPFGQGLWPAFWMLGADFPTAGWPACGEVDIMENVGREPGTTHAVLHGPGYSGGANVGSSYTLSGGRRLADDFHVYALEWEQDRVRWFLDEREFFRATPASLPAGKSWVFNHGFFLILNVAVGGIFPGNPDGTAVFPQRMLVDYVRVYTADTLAPLIQIDSHETGPRLTWPVTLPAPDVEAAEVLGGAWTPVSTPPMMEGLQWVAPVPPGYYRLRW